MQYSGKLYGKIGRKYIPLVLTSDDVENLQQECCQLKNTVSKATEWSLLSDAEMRLRCGEMTAQEIRTVRAVLGAIVS